MYIHSTPPQLYICWGQSRSQLRGAITERVGATSVWHRLSDCISNIFNKIIKFVILLASWTFWFFFSILIFSIYIYFQTIQLFMRALLWQRRDEEDGERCGETVERCWPTMDRFEPVVLPTCRLYLLYTKYIYRILIVFTPLLIVYCHIYLLNDVESLHCTPENKKPRLRISWMNKK